MQKNKKKNQKHITKIVKRDGRIVPFDETKIEKAIQKAISAVDGDADINEKCGNPKLLANQVIKILNERTHHKSIPAVEEIQDIVEEVLIRNGCVHIAKAYILYRNAHSQMRTEKTNVPEEVKRLVRESKKYFHSSYEEMIFYQMYSKWMDDKGRRETWIETVDRSMNFMKENIGKKLTDKEYKELREAILRHEVMPSNRHLWAAGPAAQRSNVTIYNCSYIAPTQFQDFGEIMYILMCGGGVGFSVETKVAQQFPIIKKQTGVKLKTHIIKDDKEGWADAFVYGVKTWFDGKDVDFDYSQIRPSGARLKVMGGRASGPEPLKNLMNFARDKILKKQGRRLSNLDLHDVICKIGEIVVAGGVRRSSLISLSDLDDIELRDAKHGQFWLTEPQRSMSNNSAVYEEKPDSVTFLSEWLELLKSGSGERGIFNRGGLKDQLPARRWKTFQRHIETAGSNPCGEIILRSKQFCNLSLIVARAEDTKESLLRKARIAAILGTYQATLTKFAYLSREWKKNCDDEALLGVSITGYWDNKVIRQASVLRALKEEIIKTNQKYAKRFKINPSTCVTAIKPAGNSGQLLYTASGIHPRFSKYYIRRVRISATDPILRMMRDQGVTINPEVGQNKENASTFVMEFPIASPKGAIVKDDVGALDMLEHWRLVKENYTEHNPSVTIYVSDDEWLEVGNWIYSHWDIVGGLSFLPRKDHVYQLAPYEEITKQQYDILKKKIGDVDFSKLSLYENEDRTTGAKEYACVGDKCELK
jgi:ribonucleoside-triphosphate reductase (thioredoxin)